jgi:hypothetical protein
MTTATHRIIGAAAVAVVVAGTSYAAVAATSSGSGVTYYACVTKKVNTLALTTRGKACPRNERKIWFDARGVRGPRGAKGPAGVGVSLVDAKHHVLGSVISASPTQVQVVTSKGFQVTLVWSGQIVQDSNHPIYNTGTCAKPLTFYALDSSDPTPTGPISTSALFYSAAKNVLLRPVATTATGTAVSSENVSAKSIYNEVQCAPTSFPFTGWKLAPIGRAAAGLPATIVAPLAMR